MNESLKKPLRSLIRFYLRTPLRGKTRLRKISDPILAPSNNIEIRKIGKCLVPLSHAFRATRNMAYDEYERRERRVLQDLVPKGGTVIDVGANVGFITAHLANIVGKSGIVYAFEPAPSLQPQLHRVARSSPESCIEVIPFAVSDRSGLATFWETENLVETGFGRLDRRPSSKFQQCKSFEVRVVSIDEFVRARAIGQIDFIKIDVEGHERSVIMGMNETLQAGQRPILMTEVTMVEPHLRELRSYSKFLISFGYRIHSFGRGLPECGIQDLPNGFHGNVLWRCQ